MAVATLGKLSAPHNYAGSAHHGDLVIKGPKFLGKEVTRLEIHNKGDLGAGALRDFLSTQYKSIVELISNIAQIVAFSIPDTPAGNMAGRVSTFSGDLWSALSVIEIPKKLIEIAGCIVDLTKIDPDNNSPTWAVLQKVFEIFCKKIAELTELICHGIGLLDRYLVPLGSDAIKTVRGIGGLATLVGCVYSLIFENAFTLYEYFIRRNEYEDRPSAGEFTVLGLEFLQNFCFAACGAFVVAAWFGAVVVAVPWLTFAFAVAGFVFMLGAFFVERIWVRPVEVQWVPV